MVELDLNCAVCKANVEGWIEKDGDLVRVFSEPCANDCEYIPELIEEQ